MPNHETIERLNESEIFVDTMSKDRSYGLIPPGIDAQNALSVLEEFLLGNVKTVTHLSVEQRNTAIVHQILEKYSSKYNRMLRKSRKENIPDNAGDHFF